MVSGRSRTRSGNSVEVTDTTRLPRRTVPPSVEGPPGVAVADVARAPEERRRRDPVGDDPDGKSETAATERET